MVTIALIQNFVQLVKTYYKNLGTNIGSGMSFFINVVTEYIKRDQG